MSDANWDEMWDELEKSEAPPEAAASDRARGFAQVNPADVYNDDTRAFIFLLAAMVHRAGGTAAFTREERETVYQLGIDQSELETTGMLRLFSIKDEA